MVVKKSLVSCFLWHVSESLVFAAVILVSNYAVVSTEWEPWVAIAKQVVLCLIFAACKCYCHHFNEKQKQNSGQKSESANVCNADYLCESLAHLSEDYEASKRTIADLREENKKLKKQGRDKDLALAQMKKKHAKEVRMKEEVLNRKNQRILENLRQREEINSLTNELNEANNQLSALNGQLIEQSDAHADHNQKLESQICKLQQNIEAYKNEVASLEDKLAKRNETIVSLEDHLSAKNLELIQLQEELTASENKAASLEETLNIKEQEIRQHEEALKTVIEHVFTNVDNLCALYNATCQIFVYLNHLVHHLKCLPPSQLAVCSAPVLECNNGYSLEGNDVCELSERDDEEDSPPDHFNSQYTHHALVTNNLFIDEWNYYSYIPMAATSYCSQVSTDIPPMEFIPFSLEISKYQNWLVVSPLFLPFPSPPPLIELHLIPT